MNRKSKIAVGVTVGLALFVGVAVALLVVYVIHPRHVRRKERNATLKLNALRRMLGPQKVDFGVPVYYINMDRSVARRQRFEAQLKEFDTKATRVPAVDGRKIQLRDANDGVEGDYMFDGSKRNVSIRGYVRPVLHDSRHLPVSKGELGCTLSHLHAIKTAHDAGDTVVLILEDDATFELVPFWPQSLQDILKHAPNDWEVLNLASSRACTGVGYAPHKSNDFFAQAYLVHRRGMKRLVDSAFAAGKETRLWPSSTLEDTRLEADHLLYNKTKTYAFLTFAPFVSYNDTASHDSTLHTNYTLGHIKKRSKHINWILRQMLTSRKTRSKVGPCTVKIVNLETRKLPYHSLHAKSFQKYADRHGYSYTTFTSFPNPDNMPVYWLKLEFVAAMLDAADKPDVVMWVDSDTVVARKHAWMPIHQLFQKQSDKSIFIGRDHPSSKHNVFCAGVFALRNNATSRAFLKECLDALKSNRDCRDSAGKFITKGTWGQSDCFEQGVMNSLLAKRAQFSDALHELEPAVVRNSRLTHDDCLILHKFNKTGLSAVFESVGYI